MKLNTNHPTFIAFLDTVNSNILSEIKINNYFKISQEKKFAIQYVVLKQMKSSVKINSKLAMDELKSFIVLLQTKNEKLENYEFAQLLKDLMNNLEAVNNFVKPTRKTKTIRMDKTQNGE
jgi:hypothetical protein